MATLSSLPPEVVEAIAFKAGLQHPHEPPTSLLTLLLLNRSFYHLLRPSSNARLYSRLFKQRFDVQALERRFGRGAEAASAGGAGRGGKGKASLVGAGVAAHVGCRAKSEPRHEGSLVISTSKANPSPASQDFAAATFPAIRSPSASGQCSPSASSPLTARQLADAFIDRIAFLKRLRRCARESTLESVGGSGGVTSNRPIPHHELFGEANQRQLTKDLWTAYLMVLENDGKNLEQLVRFGDIRRFLTIYYVRRFRRQAAYQGLANIDEFAGTRTPCCCHLARVPARDT